MRLKDLDIPCVDFIDGHSLKVPGRLAKPGQATETLNEQLGARRRILHDGTSRGLMSICRQRRGSGTGRALMCSPSLELDTHGLSAPHQHKPKTHDMHACAWGGSLGARQRPKMRGPWTRGAAKSRPRGSPIQSLKQAVGFGMFAASSTKMVR